MKHGPAVNWDGRMKFETDNVFPSVELCVGALTKTIEQNEAVQRKSVSCIVGFLFAAQAKVPDYMGFPFRILRLIFDTWPYRVAGKPFHRLDLRRRIAQV